MPFTHIDLDADKYSDLLEDNYKPYYRNAGRYYRTPNGKDYPSITTVLGANPEKKASLAAWRQRVGHAEAERVSRTARERGTSMHLICERYVDNEDDYLRGAMPDAIAIFNKLKPHFDEHLDQIHGQEFTMYSDVLGVAGRADCIGNWDGVLSIIDFKNSNKPKRREWIDDYFMQCAAYAAMYYERTGIPIRDMVVAIGVQDSEPQIFKDKVATWLPRLKDAIVEFNAIYS